MRQGAGITPPRGSTPMLGSNPKVWAQLDNENQNTNAMLLETVEELQTKMMNLRADNERLRFEQEKIMKNISD